MVKRIPLRNMQQSQPTTNRTVRGHMSAEGNTIEFQLGHGIVLSVYRNGKGDWIARFTGLPRGKS
jgi:hypothetical protein